jgi:hypothetical protein
LCLLGKFSIMAATPTLKPGHSSTVPRVKTKAHPDRLQTLSPKYHALQWLSSRQQHLLIRDQTLWWIQTGFFLFSICATTAKVSDCDPFLVRRKSPKKQKQQQQPITTHKEVLKSNLVQYKDLTERWSSAWLRVTKFTDLEHYSLQAEERRGLGSMLKQKGRGGEANESLTLRRRHFFIWILECLCSELHRKKIMLFSSLWSHVPSIQTKPHCISLQGLPWWSTINWLS